MLGRHVKVATAQGADEITGAAQATEKAGLASNQVGFDEPGLPGLNMQSPLCCFETAKVAPSKLYPKDARRIRG